ncbi:unnamed protein product [Scytosiphon promiscuus]
MAVAGAGGRRHRYLYLYLSFCAPCPCGDRLKGRDGQGDNGQTRSPTRNATFLQYKTRVDKILRK